jgi:hypothetical protein
MWASWHRKNPRSPWVRMCEAETLDACHKALLDAVKGRCFRNTDLFLTRDGKTPRSSAMRPLRNGCNV